MLICVTSLGYFTEAVSATAVVTYIAPVRYALTDGASKSSRDEVIGL